MWEYWRSRLSKGRTRHRKRTGSDGDSPTAQRCANHLACSLHIGTLQPAGLCSLHIYYNETKVVSKVCERVKGEPQAWYLKGYPPVPSCNSVLVAMYFTRAC